MALQPACLLQHPPGVVPAVEVPPEVAEPDVIARVSQKEAEGLAAVADDPVGRGAEEAVLGSQVREELDTWSLPAGRRPAWAGGGRGPRCDGQSACSRRL